MYQKLSKSKTSNLESSESKPSNPEYFKFKSYKLKSPESKSSNLKSSNSKIGGLWDALGRVLFFVTWPGIWLVIKTSRERTRVVVRYKGQALIARDWLGPGQWSLPGGGLRWGEDPAVGAVRELSEEVALVIPKEKLRFFGRFKIKSNGIKIKYVVYVADFDIKPEVTINNSEISEVKWIDIDIINDQSNPVGLSNSAIQILQAFSKADNLLK